MVTLEQIKNYLRISYDEDDSYIESLISVADSYLQSGITDYKKKSKNKLFKAKAQMLELTLIQNLYDERYLVGQPLETSYIIKSMINQLEYGDYNV